MNRKSASGAVFWQYEAVFWQYEAGGFRKSASEAGLKGLFSAKVFII